MNDLDLDNLHIECVIIMKYNIIFLKKDDDLILDRQNGIHKQPQYINGIMNLLVVEH